MSERVKWWLTWFGVLSALVGGFALAQWNARVLAWIAMGALVLIIVTFITAWIHDDF